MTVKKTLTRRQFLRGTAGAAAAAMVFPTIIPSSVLGANGAVAPSNRFVMGCVGTGGQGKNNIKAFLKASDVQVTAVCDVDKIRMKEAASIVNEKYGNKDCRTYGDFRQLIAKEKTDLMLICTPDHWHGIVSVEALKAGNDVYCEKPLTNTIAEGRAICDAVKRYNRVFQTGSHERSNNTVRYACELVRNGRIGKLHTLQVNMPNTDPHHLKMIATNQPQPIMPVPEQLDYDMWLGPAPLKPYTELRGHFFWRFILDYGGGEMTDRGAHIIDIGQFINNSDNSGPVEINAKGRRADDGIFDTFMEYGFECTYANGVKLIGTSKGNRGIRLEGTDGWIFINIHGGRLEASNKSILKEIIRPDEIHVGRTTGHHENFLDAVRNRRFETNATAEIGHRTGTICHLLNIAMLTGNVLKWDPVKEQITNDEFANRMISRPMRSPWRI